MTREKSHIPIASPIRMCIPQMQINQLLRVLLLQMKNTLARFEKTNNNSYHWQNKLPSNKYLRIDNVKRRTYQRPPYVEQSTSHCRGICQATEKIDEA